MNVAVKPSRRAGRLCQARARVAKFLARELLIAGRMLLVVACVTVVLIALSAAGLVVRSGWTERGIVLATAVVGVIVAESYRQRLAKCDSSAGPPGR